MSGVYLKEEKRNKANQCVPSRMRGVWPAEAWEEYWMRGEEAQGRTSPTPTSTGPGAIYKPSAHVDEKT